MLANSSIIGFVPVSDFKLAQEFYAGTLGLAIVDRTNPYALVLATSDGTMIRCILVQDLHPQSFTILGWEVADIHAVAQELIAAGVKPIVYPYFTQAEDGVWTAPGGDMVLWFHDPDGNVLSLSQHTQKAAQ